MVPPSLNQRGHPNFTKTTMNSTKAYYDKFNMQSTLKLESVDPAIITDILAKTNT